MKFLHCFIAVCFMSVVGCPGQNKLTIPKIDPVSAAAEAIKLYDADGDGAIDKSEAKKTALDPSKGWDSDDDGRISESEISNRLTTYEAMKPGVQMNVMCTVLHKGRPLEGAEVTYEPEPFLGGAVPLASGTTDAEGIAEMVAPEISDPTLKGMHTGLYHVRITHPEKEIAAKYNTETELFIELSPMDMQSVQPIFKLKK